MLLTWKRDYEGAARQVAYLGDIAVGAVICNEADRKARQAQWMTWLPNTRGSTILDWKWVKTEEQAISAVSAGVTDWLRTAGILSLAERDRADVGSLPLFSETDKERRCTEY
jgi:hypothetical protein